MTDYKRWQKIRLKELLTLRRVVMLMGARQCGKTTLARSLISKGAVYRTLDDQVMRQAAFSDPQLFVGHVLDHQMLIIDEVQKVPELLPAIKSVVDRNNKAGQFLITGSANILSLPTVQESLAGRVGRIRLRALSQGEVLGTKPVFLERAVAQSFKRGKKRLNRDGLIEIILRGGFPECIRLKEGARKGWHKDYIETLLEHDLKDIANVRRIDIMKELARVLAAWSSKFLDFSALGSKLAVDRRTLTQYISALQAFYIVESVPAWHKGDYDRVGKQSKIFMTDTGMMAALLGWKKSDLEMDSDKSGKAFETFAFNEIAAQVDASPYGNRLYHYRDKDKREIDFLIERDDGVVLAIEIKSSITVKKADFKHVEWFRDHLADSKNLIGIVLYAGDEILPFGKNLWAVPFDCMWAV